jgi:hypothetical protein
MIGMFLNEVGQRYKIEKNRSFMEGFLFSGDAKCSEVKMSFLSLLLRVESSKLFSQNCAISRLREATEKIKLFFKKLKNSDSFG